MSKPVKEMIRKELVSRFAGVTSMAVVGFSGLDAEANHTIRGKLREKDIRLSVVKNSLARQAFDRLGLQDAGRLLDGPCAVAYGADSVVAVVRELLDLNKQYPALELKSALLDGELFQGAEEVKRLGSFPTREEAVAEVLGCVLSAGGALAGCLAGPGGQIASILKSIEEKQDGEAEAA